VHELAGAGPAPAALEEGPEADCARVAREAPALVGHDRAQEAARVPARALRGQPVDAVEVARLVVGTELGVAPVAGHREVRHVSELRNAVEPGVADAVVDRVRRVVRRLGDHRPERGALGGVGHAVADAAQVRHEQHRLDEAGAHVRTVRREAVDAAPAVDQRPRVDSTALLEEAPNRADPLDRREAGGEGVARDPAPAPRAGRHFDRGEATRENPDAARTAVGGRVQQRAVAVAGALVAHDLVAARLQAAHHPEARPVPYPPAHDRVSGRVAHPDEGDRSFDVEGASCGGLLEVERAGGGFCRGWNGGRCERHRGNQRALHRAQWYGCPYGLRNVWDVA
jgi:hypothetical protein